MAKENCAGLCPAYFDELVGPTRVRYKEKIVLCDGVDPYQLPVGAQAAVNASLLPPVTHVDIINYLVLSTSYASLDQMKAYKSLDSHNYFTSGWVRNLIAKKLPSKRVVLLSQVKHSQRLREASLKVWLLANKDGSIITARCTCTAGAGEACSHVGATLFAVETAMGIRDSATCTDKSNVWLPAHSPMTEFKRLQDIDFSSCKAKKKKRMDTIHIHSPDTRQPSRPVPQVIGPTPDELERRLPLGNLLTGHARADIFDQCGDYLPATVPGQYCSWSSDLLPFLNVRDATTAHPAPRQVDTLHLAQRPSRLITVYFC
ncbi:uncharacterized protein LOC125945034 [Dermacentor silvarum]|uniref:uncharacterized protein LOC125945034 n=1 Tax=Dermacentor silvarum TaxID=543639 RepID=UPI0021013C40|nr:uncharacterized protein LOC125945034 [Dermacentor silvarum]